MKATRPASAGGDFARYDADRHGPNGSSNGNSSRAAAGSNAARADAGEGLRGGMGGGSGSTGGRETTIVQPRKCNFTSAVFFCFVCCLFCSRIFCIDHELTEWGGVVLILTVAISK